MLVKEKFVKSSTRRDKNINYFTLDGACFYASLDWMKTDPYFDTEEPLYPLDATTDVLWIDTPVSTSDINPLKEYGHLHYMQVNTTRLLYSESSGIYWEENNDTDDKLHIIKMLVKVPEDKYIRVWVKGLDEEKQPRFVDYTIDINKDVYKDSNNKVKKGTGNWEEYTVYYLGNSSNKTIRLLVNDSSNNNMINELDAQVTLWSIAYLADIKVDKPGRSWSTKILTPACWNSSWVSEISTKVLVDGISNCSIYPNKLRYFRWHCLDYLTGSLGSWPTTYQNYYFLCGNSFADIESYNKLSVEDTKHSVVFSKKE